MVTGPFGEIIVVDNGSTDGTAEFLEEFQEQHQNVRVFHCDHVIGDAAGKNIGLKQSGAGTSSSLTPPPRS